MDALRLPAHLFYQSEFIRRWILASYWLVIFLSVPLWWRTTSLERLSLPSSRVLAQSHKQLEFPIQLLVGPSLFSKDSTFIPNLRQILTERASRESWSGIHLSLNETLSETDDHSTSNKYIIVAGNHQPSLRNRILSYPVDGRTSVPVIAEMLSSLLIPPSQNPHIAQYSPRYRLSFTLMNEDAADGPSITDWDIRSAISRHILPITNGLAILHNFTIESQVQYHGPLAFQPLPTEPDAYGLTQEDLTVFVNSAEWTLSSSVSEDPVLHFLVFVPTASRRPLLILDKQGVPMSSTAFILPQWGGIFIHNPSPNLASHSAMDLSDIDRAFLAFSKQLLTLLGVPPLPANVHPEYVGANKSLLTSWQLDSLLRRRAFENANTAKDTLLSTVNLVAQIEGMPVGESVRGDVEGALNALESMHSSHLRSLTETLRYSARATTQASRAFFNPEMLAMLYFPAEHKYAVYTPLFASAVIPLVAAAAREILVWKRNRGLVAQQVQ
ncbi:phosphatidylinositol-glycan biosynthesis class S protein [Mycena floridula]|nr:phosphatidylinositol-glycan biosynthesis class S protein [Mycena floridula]